MGKVSWKEEESFQKGSESQKEQLRRNIGEKDKASCSQTEGVGAAVLHFCHILNQT